MRRVAEWAGVVLGGVVVLVVVLLAVVVGGSATRPGQVAIERLVPPLTGGMVRVRGLSGWLFGAARVARVEVNDSHGTWLTIDDLALDWSPLRLIGGEVSVQRIAAADVAVVRRPVSSGSGGTIGLPVRVDIAALHVGRLDLAVAALGLGSDRNGRPAGGQTGGPTGDQTGGPTGDQTGVATSGQTGGQTGAATGGQPGDQPGAVIGDQTGSHPGERVVNRTASLEVDGAARLEALDRGTVQLALRRLDMAGTYTATAQFDPAGLRATLHLVEPAGGLVGSLAALPAIGAIDGEATLGGKFDAIATQATLTAGALHARITGQVDVTGRSADLSVAVEAPPMAPRADLAWNGVTLTGTLRGSFAKPDARARLVADGLVLGQGGVGRITADIEGDAGRLTLNGALDGIRLPGPRPDVLGEAPVEVTGTLLLGPADRPLTFSLRDKLFNVDGTAATAGAQQVQAQVILPDIAPLAAVAGLDAGGNVALNLHAARLGEDTQIGVQGQVGLTSGPGPSVALLGPSTTLDVRATLRGETVRLTQLNIDSNAVSAGMTGTLAPGALDLDWRVAVADLAVASPTLTGPLRVSGKASGAPANLTVSADVTGEIGAAGIAPGAVSAQVALNGLPGAPIGHVAALGTLLGAKLDVAVTAVPENGQIRVAIERADWKSAHAGGTLLIDPSGLLPVGQVSFSVARLDDLQPLLGLALGGGASGGGAIRGSLRGSLDGKLDSRESGASLTVTATNAGLSGIAAVARAALDMKVTEPIAHPLLDGRLTLDGVAGGGMTGSGRIEAKGKLDALALRLSAALPELAGAPARIDAAGTLDTASRTGAIASLTAEWQQVPIRLLAPVRIGFASGVSLEHLRLGLGEAVLEANGRITPALDLTARLRGMPARLAVRLAGMAGQAPADRASGIRASGAPVPATPAGVNPAGVNPAGAKRTAAPVTAAAPESAPPASAISSAAAPTSAAPTLALDGTLDAEATLTGTPPQPGGTIHVTARGLRASTGQGRALPAAEVTATATLHGASARVDLRGKAGTTQVTVTGEVPLTATGALDLRATGGLDLAMTDPLLTPAGRRARGRVSLDAGITGTLAGPRLTGGVQLANGSFRDFAQGIDISDINASLAADGGTVRVTRFAGKAGTGTIDASGSLDLTAPGRPLDLTFNMRNARPLASDLLTADLDATVTLRGDLTPSGSLIPSGEAAAGADGAAPLTVAGRVFVRRAEIRVPERLPTGIAVLNVRVAGAPPPPRPAPPPDLALNLTIDAPQQVFVRGRGVDAEMGGEVRVQGSTSNLAPSGGFSLRHGQFSVAGQTLTFNTGKVSFDGGKLTDPSLDFTATTTASDVTATLEITGTASKPKITLSSVPSLPQDEVLAYLLYGKSSASLGPLEIAQIAATLASLAGVTTLSNPLESVRTALGLDRLSVGSGSVLEAGRYVARNVYVGARQNVAGSGTQAVVQVDLAKGLKLEATAGTAINQSATGAASTGDAASVGIKYEFEY